MGPRESVLDRGPEQPCKGAIFRGNDMPGDTVVSCAKTVEQIMMPFGLWAWVG